MIPQSRSNCNNQNNNNGNNANSANNNNNYFSVQNHDIDRKN